jgi:hypothetical protein
MEEKPRHILDLKRNVRIRGMKKMKCVLIIASTLLMACNASPTKNIQDIIKKDKDELLQDVNFLEENCPNDVQKDCDCDKYVLKRDTNIYLISTFCFPPYKEDGTIRKNIFDLYLYGKKVDLRAKYYSEIRNKDIIYMQGVTKTSCKLEVEKIKLDIECINGGVNTNFSTRHSFHIVYDKIKKNVDTLSFWAASAGAFPFSDN